MLRTTEDTEEKAGDIRRTPFSYLEELDYADDLGLALLLHTNIQIQETTQRLNLKKTEVLALNITNSPVQVENEDLPYTDKFIPKNISTESVQFFWTPDKSNAAPMAAMFYL